MQVLAATGSPHERERVELLARLRHELDLTRFEHTGTVVIEAGAIPHSHPVLTLNTRRCTELEFLATYLHEQMHWWSLACPGALDGRHVAVFADLSARYLPIPFGGPGQCDSELSTLIHLQVCWLELEALAALIGDHAAATIVAAADHYTEVYEIVLRDRSWLADRFTAAGMGLPPATPD